ncbi:MAG: hypothetical protein K2N03_06755, partial [Muribaculaceae bacterium]|nr:hypothetical protein [Muribaculaceae bacterium]
RSTPLYSAAASDLYKRQPTYLYKAHKLAISNYLTTAPVFQHEFNLRDGSTLCAGVDMIRDKRLKQTTFGLGLQYNF